MILPFDFCRTCEREHGAFSAIAKHRTEDLTYLVGSPYCKHHKAPDGPISGFGKEKTLHDYQRRIAWEAWAANVARDQNCEAMAQAHDLTRATYESELRRQFGSVLAVVARALRK